MSDSLRVIAPCGCEYEPATGTIPVVSPRCDGFGWGSDTWYRAVDRAYRAGMLHAAYAMAARDGVGPWAKRWPGRGRNG